MVGDANSPDEGTPAGEAAGSVPRIWVAGTIACVAAWAAFLPLFLARPSWVFTWDTAPYIETANSLLAGRGLMQRTIFGLGPAIWEPIRNWPPGYSVLIALAELTGLSAPMAAVAVTLLASGVFVALVASFCLKRFHWTVALPLALTTAWMPAFLRMSSAALSDALYLAFAVASIVCLANWSREGRGSPRWILAAGLMAGAAWATRYAGLALLVTSAVFIAMHLLWRRRRDVVEGAMVWLAGTAVCAAPFAIRNLTRFGRINPFLAAPSDMGLTEIVHANWLVFVGDLTTSLRVAHLAANPVLLLLTGAGAACVILVWLVRARKPGNFAVLVAEWRLELLLAGYTAAQFALLVGARLTYALTDPPAGNAHRVFGQVYWAVWLLLALAVSRVLPSSTRWRVMGRSLLAAGLCVIAALQALAAVRELRTVPRGVLSVESLMDADVSRLLSAEVGKSQIVISPRAYLLRIVSDVNGRKIAMASQCPYQPCFTLAALRAAGASGLLWGAVLDDPDGLRKGEYGELFADMFVAPDKYPEFARIPTHGPAVVLKYVGAARRPD